MSNDNACTDLPLARELYLLNQHLSKKLKLEYEDLCESIRLQCITAIQHDNKCVSAIVLLHRRLTDDEFKEFRRVHKVALIRQEFYFKNYALYIVNWSFIENKH